jgi:eukaryotic-like serine/threonine-protein kinase
MGIERGAVTNRLRRESQPASGTLLVPEPEVVMPFEIGEIIGGKYEVIRLIGSGGMGFVISANHIELGEKVALKFLHRESLANQELVGRFAREARASLRIQSEHVARVFDVGALPSGSPFIVMEYLEGKNLHETVRDAGPLPIKMAIEYVMQACEALAVAHANGIVHRDIKPENLFLTQRTQGMDIIKVLDFGISKVALTGSAFEMNVPLVRTTMAMGSPVYMSPEQIRASPDIDARTDIWSLGCVLFELLTGNAAFDAPSLTQLSAVILENDPPLLRSLCANAPLDLEKIVSRCLQKDPSRRFQNVGELALALFPFAPRRARISAERCMYVLKAAGMIEQDYELPSAYPPSFSSTPVRVEVPANDPVQLATLSKDDIRASGRVSYRPKWRLLMVAMGAAAIVGGYVSWSRRGSILEQPGRGLESTDALQGIAPAAPVVLIAPAPSVAPAVGVDPSQLDVVFDPPSAGAPVSAASTSKIRPSPAAPAPRPKVRSPARPAANDSSGNHDPDPGF